MSNFGCGVNSNLAMQVANILPAGSTGTATPSLNSGIGSTSGPLRASRSALFESGNPSNVAMRSAKSMGRQPRELAAELAEQIAALEDVDSSEVAGPGFINLRLADSFFVSALGEVGESYGGGWAAAAAERLQVEMVSANPTGPLLVSHARNGAYGDSVARLLAFGGHAVEREYYYNDAGAQIDRFRASVDALRRGEPVPEDG